MNTKECIEFLEYIDGIYIFSQVYINTRNKIKEVIKRLQMWEDFKDDNGSVWGYGKGKYIRQLMDEFELKYFPKGKLEKKLTDAQKNVAEKTEVSQDKHYEEQELISVFENDDFRIEVYEEWK